MSYIRLDQLKNYYLCKSDKRGITMMETIVALGILVLGIITTLTLMTSTIIFSQASEQSIVVVNLAREGIEAARGIRDLNGFDALSVGNKTVDVDGDLELENATFDGEENIENCTNCDLYLNSGRYLHSGSAEQKTIFRRLVIISDESANEKKIISQVYWSEHGRAHTFTLEDHLTDW